MSHKIIVHIGLPKTGTTSLQVDLFPKLGTESIEYLGVFHPRDRTIESEIYQNTLNALNSGQNIASLRESLSEALELKSLLLSEEMITVSNLGISWREKLSNLKSILDGFNYEIVVTVREPGSALFSYYCEIYTTLKCQNKSFIECALNHEALQIFHYQKLITELNLNFEKERLHFYKFEDVILNSIQQLTSLITDQPSEGFEISVENRNSREMKRGLVITNHFLTAADLLRFHHPLNRGEPSHSKAKNRIRNFLHRIPLHRIKIKKPSLEEMSQLRDCLYDETRVLEQEYSIRY